MKTCSNAVRYIQKCFGNVEINVCVWTMYISWHGRTLLLDHKLHLFQIIPGPFLHQAYTTSLQEISYTPSERFSRLPLACLVSLKMHCSHWEAKASKSGESGKRQWRTSKTTNACNECFLNFREQLKCFKTMRWKSQYVAGKGFRFNTWKLHNFQRTCQT